MDLDSKLKQTCVYWQPLFPDGFGGYDLIASSETNTGTGTATADVSPDERTCRWDDVNEMILNVNGEEVLSKAQVILREAVEVGGYLFLGTEGSAPADPSTSLLAHKIIRVGEIPDLKNEETIWEAFL